MEGYARVYYAGAAGVSRSTLCPSPRRWSNHHDFVSLATYLHSFSHSYSYISRVLPATSIRAVLTSGIFRVVTKHTKLLFCSPGVLPRWACRASGGRLPRRPWLGRRRRCSATRRRRGCRKSSTVSLKRQVIGSLVHPRRHGCFDQSTMSYLTSSS